jgi:putative component of membrane protein insertase Oxa1/YidC/SpoIIIJ protein YidD
MQKRVHHAVYRILVLFVFFTTSCNEWYNHPLGNHLSLWEGDTKEDRTIVYCEGGCHAGIDVVPTYERRFDSSKQHYAEYVETATSNKKWVLVKTLQIKEKQENYWIISKDFSIENLDCSKSNCDSIIQSHVIGPLNYSNLQKEIRGLKIDLHL